MARGRAFIASGRRLSVALASLLCCIASLDAQTTRQLLETAKTLKCDFTLMTTGTWNADGSPQAQVRERRVSFVFKSIDTQEGSAQIDGSSAAPSIIVQLSGGYLHFMQIAATGYLYTTTVFDKPSRPGKLKAVHTRHEYTDVALPGYTSRPEQYFGDCDVIN
jgi:hypothetical protein